MTKPAAVLAACALALAGCSHAVPRKASAQGIPVPTTPPSAALLHPEKATATAPAVYQVRFETSRGPFVVKVTRAWAPKGADRLYNLVKLGFYRDVVFFRVLDGFMAQFGFSPYPSVNRAWDEAPLKDDPVTHSNTRGMVTFATAGPDTRTTQLFVNTADNARLDARGFAPVGQVVSGMKVVDSLYSGYGEGAPQGNGPAQPLIEAQGNSYLARRFPKLDWIEKATIVP